jgi:mono/diheme cytochrome c family protein
MPQISGMNDILAGQLLDMIARESKLPQSQFSGLTLGDQPFTAADVLRGYEIFVGQRRLTNGGAQCISCHTVQGIGGLGGGQVGPDLTRVFERLNGRKNLAAWLQAPATPTMRPVFMTRALTNDEIVGLVAYFENAAKKPANPDDPTQLGFLFLGIGGAAVGFITADALWRKRFRAVRRPMTRGEK